MNHPHCHWVRDRLPLLAGNDLLGSERRRVERHLVGCPECHGRFKALGRALRVLETAASESPSRGDAPSLWPAVARQLRESRRPVPSFGPNWPVLGLRLRMRLWPTLALAAGLSAVVGLTVSAHRQVARSRAEIARNSGPVAVPAHAVPAPAPVPAAPTATEQVAQHADPVPEAAPPPSRYDYALEHGTPMGPDAPDARSKLTH